MASRQIAKAVLPKKVCSNPILELVVQKTQFKVNGRLVQNFYAGIS